MWKMRGLIVQKEKVKKSIQSSFLHQQISFKENEMKNEIRNEIADLAVLAASKVVGKTIDVADHQNMVDNFVKEVGEAK